MKQFILGILVCLLCGWAANQTTKPAATQTGRDAHDAHDGHAPNDAPVRLGNFSISLNVKDVPTSRAFYEKLGFRMVGGVPAKNWVIMQNETSTIGLFHGAFERNSLTFNPGWDRSGKTLADFDDVREIQRILKARGLNP